VEHFTAPSETLLAHPTPDDPLELAEQIRTVCEVYEATPTLAATGPYSTSTFSLSLLRLLLGARCPRSARGIACLSHDRPFH
jgi:hypothetical protein